VPASTLATILTAVTPTGEQMIEELRRVNEAINRGDFDAAVEIADRDIVFVRPGGLPELRGREAIRAWMEPDAFESQTYEILSHEADGNRLLVKQNTRARGAGSGIEMEIESFSVWSFNDECKVTRVEYFMELDEEQARRALRDR
jgi:limonene-1,2-epoxide hydrolase